MPNMTVKGVPDGLYRRLKERAQRNRRSLNSEVIVCLEDASSTAAVDPETWLAEVDELRNRVATTPLTDAAINEAKNRGRP